MGLLRFCFLAVGVLCLAASAKAFCHNDLQIIGGRNVTLKDAPFIASINEVQNENHKKVCAGSVIHERVILTAASCVDGDKTLARSVHVGTEVSYLSVEDVLCHEKYTSEDLTNDICLLKLASAVPYASAIKITLPEKDLVLEVGTLVNATGWGATRRDGEMETELHQVMIPVLKQKCCDEVYVEFNGNQICAGARRRDFCEGDMGGPLTLNSVLVGVISGDGECGTNPGIYTRVSSYLDWINSTINNNL